MTLVTLAPACGDDDDDSGGDGDADGDTDADGGADAAASCPEPVAPAGPGTMSIGFAGAPVALFGDEDAPDFAAPFEDMAADGVDLFVPVFQLSESEDGGTFTRHIEHFLAPACDGPANPYEAARGKLRIVFPGFALIDEPEWTAPLVEEDVAARLQGVIDDCMGGDDSVLGGVEVFHEPGSRGAFLALDEDPDDDLLAANIPAAAAAFRTVTDAPMAVVEAAVPFILERYPESASLTAEERTAITEQFWPLVEGMAGASDVYGFEVYPIDKPLGDPPALALEAVGFYVDQARGHEPAARLLAVLQGFGEDDLGARAGRQPTAGETRFMAIDALLHGARVIVWYGQSAIEADGQLWEDLRATARELRTIAPLLDLQPIDLPPQTSRVEARGFDDGAGTVYIIAANPTEGEQRLSVPLFRPGGEGHATLRDFTSGEVLAGDGNLWTEDLAGRGVRVMSLTACD